MMMTMARSGATARRGWGLVALTAVLCGALVGGVRPAAAVQQLTPPDVVPILAKLADDKALSAAELTRLTAWYGGESTRAVDAFEREEPETDELTADLLQDNPNVRLAAVKPPTREGLLALAKEAQALYGERLDDPLRQQLDTAIGKATRAGFGADLGAVLLLCQDAPAAAYATAAEVLKHPDDPLTINNLGACLKSVREYPRALKVLLHAHQIGPDLVLATTNLGWTQALMGDLATAQQTLEEAVAQDSEDARAIEGLGLIAVARGDRETAVRMLVASLKCGYGPGAKAGLEVLADSEDIVSDRPGETNNASGADGGAGAGMPPIEHPDGKGSGAPPNFDPPPPIGTVDVALANHTAVAEWAMRANQKLMPVIERHTTVGVRGGMERARLESQAGPNVWIRSNERELFVLGKLQVIFANRISRLWDQCGFGDLEAEMQAKLPPIDEQYKADCEACARGPEAQYEPCLAAAKAKHCRQKQELAEQYYARFYPLWRDLREQVIRELVDYYHFASPWLQDIRDRDLNEERNLEREIFIRATDENLRMLYLNLLTPLWHQTMECAELRESTAKDGDNEVGAESGKDCKIASFGIKLWVVTLEGSCDKLKLEVGEGALVAVEYKPGKTPDRDETTIFVGAGVESDAGVVKFDIKAGGYVTVKGDGTLVDVGLQESLGGSLNLGPVSVGGEIEGRLGIESGLNASVEAKFGGAAGGD